MVSSGSIALDARLALQGAGLCMAVVWESSSRGYSLSSGRECIVLVVAARREIVGGLVGLQRRKVLVGVGLHSPCLCWLVVLMILWSTQEVQATLVGVPSRHLKEGQWGRVVTLVGWEAVELSVWENRYGQSWTKSAFELYMTPDARTLCSFCNMFSNTRGHSDLSSWVRKRV